MILRGRKGFTLIELLVVIAIIAILAAMLFPVFARARESARKIQCLSNVKNVAMAIQMYLTDYDRFPPGEHRAEIRDWYFNEWSCCCEARLAGTNPYLRWPVILDEYIKNRDIWRCPSARYINQWQIIGNDSIDANGDWWDAFLVHEGECPGVRGNDTCFPPGWGGTATDKFAQGCDGRSSSDAGGFEMSIGTAPRWALGLKTGQMGDPTHYAVAYDSGVSAAVDRTSLLAYPDTCRIDGVACDPNCGGDWDNCSWAVYCSAERGEPRWATDVQYRKDHAKGRHLGGTNLGFADGHAAWWASEQIMFAGENWSGYAANPDNPLLPGFGVCTTPALVPYVWP